jgi:hypothetical protein
VTHNAVQSKNAHGILRELCVMRITCRIARLRLRMLASAGKCRDIELETQALARLL